MLLALPKTEALHSSLRKCSEFMRHERDGNNYDREYRDTVALIKSAIDVCKIYSE